MTVRTIAGVFTERIEALRADSALRLFGAALALGNAITFVQWKFNSGVPLMIGRGRESLCWPWWTTCHAWALPVRVVNYGLWLYLLVALFAASCFLTRRVTAGYWLLLLVNLMRMYVVLQDYRLRANHHHMLNWAVMAFLFLPYMRTVLRQVLVMIYFWAGALKLHPDWLSGVTLYSQDRLWFPQWLVPAACVYVVVLEMGLIWGLYASRGWIFWGVLTQLVLFHFTSWPIVGFWYPALMFCLLSILPLMRLLPPPDAPVGLTAPRAWKPAVVGTFAVVFAVLQLVPRAFPGDTAITGEGRFFALHMFDARVECSATVTYHMSDGGQETEVRRETTQLPHRSRCDPLIYYAIARNACAHLGEPGRTPSRNVPVDLDLRLQTKRISSPEYTQVLDIERFCAAPPAYAVWHHNDWIGGPGGNAAVPSAAIAVR